MEKKEKEMLELASEPQRSFSKQIQGREDESELNGEMKGRTDSSEYTDSIISNVLSPLFSSSVWFSQIELDRNCEACEDLNHWYHESDLTW